MLDRGPVNPTSPELSHARIEIRAVARWILTRHVTQPFFWVWLVLLVMLWPAVQLFSPLGVTSAARGNQALVYEIAFIGLLVGSSFGLDALARGGWIVIQVAAPQRLWVEALGVLVSALLFLVAGLAAPAVLGGLEASLLPALGMGAVLSLFHLTALALVLRRLPLPASLHAALLPLIAWALPATLGRGNRVGEIASLWLDASRHLERGFGLRTISEPAPGPVSGIDPGFDLASTVFGTAVAPIMMLALAATLIALRPRPQS